MEYLICIPIAVFVWLLIGGIVNDRQKTRRYQEYIDSIRVGDIFEPNFISIRVDIFDSNFIEDLYDDPYDDPFEEEFNYSEYSTVIIDIKKNNKGETWVKYKRLKDEDVYGTEEIHKFVINNKRVKQSEI